MKKIIILLFTILLSCKTEVKSQFSKEALADKLVSLDNKNVTLQEVLATYKGKKILIDVWASWCADCIKGMPKVVKLQKQYPNVEYVFFSLDKSIEDWKYGIKKYRVEGTHYFLQSGWKGALGKFLDIDWIPRYLVVSEEGEILIFKSVHADDDKIVKALKK